MYMIKNCIIKHNIYMKKHLISLTTNIKKYKIISFRRFLWFQHNSKNCSSKLEDLTVMLQMMNMGMGYFRGEGPPFLYKKKHESVHNSTKGCRLRGKLHVWIGTFFFREMTVRMFRVDAGILARFYKEYVKTTQKLRYVGDPTLPRDFGQSTIIINKPFNKSTCIFLGILQGFPCSTMIWGLAHRRFASYNLPRRRQEGKISGQFIVNPCPEFGPFGGILLYHHFGYPRLRSL